MGFTKCTKLTSNLYWIVELVLVLKYIFVYSFKSTPYPAPRTVEIYSSGKCGTFLNDPLSIFFTLVISVLQVCEMLEVHQNSVPGSWFCPGPKFFTFLAGTN